MLSLILSEGFLSEVSMMETLAKGMNLNKKSL
jgi:hypothetical protein